MGMGADLYDLAPVVRVLAVGACVALLPLWWVWRRTRGQPVGRRLHALTVLTLFLTFDLVLFGAFTRLTDSGLGCPDWPGCYGSASPLGAHGEIRAAQAAMPTGPVTWHKAWVEMIHRYLATGVGGLMVVLTVGSWWHHLRRKWQPHSTLGQEGTLPVHPLWPTATLVWVCLQGAFGALTVTMKLFPAIVTLHLLGGIVLLVLLAVQVSLWGRGTQAARCASVPSGTRVALGCVAGLLLVQVLLGGWVSTNYAVLVCNTFPQCQGQWWPTMDFVQGFEIWRPLGVLRDGTSVGFAALTAIHYTHRLMAYGVLAALLWLAWRLQREGTWGHLPRWLWGLTGLQALTGLSNVVLGWPLVAAVLHTGGAAALCVVVAWALAQSYRGGAAVHRGDRVGSMDTAGGCA